MSFSGPDGAPLETSEQVRRALLPEDYGEQPEVSGPYWLRAWVAERTERAIDDPEAVIREMGAWLPRVMFVLVPVFALLLSLVYAWRRGFFYFDHLITALHFHAAMFIAMTVTAALMPHIAGWAILGMIVYANMYLYRQQRVVYERGRFATLMRTLVLDLLYAFVLTAGLFAALLAGFASV